MDGGRRLERHFEIRGAMTGGREIVRLCRVLCLVQHHTPRFCSIPLDRLRLTHCGVNFKIAEVDQWFESLKEIYADQKWDVIQRTHVKGVDKRHVTNLNMAQCNLFQPGHSRRVCLKINRPITQLEFFMNIA